jgi:hypothetical protein
MTRELGVQFQTGAEIFLFESIWFGCMAHVAYIMMALWGSKVAAA